MPHLRFHFLLKHRHNMDGMRAFYLNTALRSLVFALIGIFTPVYLYRQGAEVFGGNSAGLIIVALFYIIVRLTTLSLAIPVSKTIERLGFRRSILVSAILLALHIVSLYLADGRHEMWLLPAAILIGVETLFYWISRMSAISIDSSIDAIGKQVGILTILERASYILGPFAGGIIIEIWGFRVLYSVSFFLLIASIVPIFMMGHHVHRNGVSLKGFWLWTRDRRFFHQAVATVGRAGDDYAGGVVWPLVVSLMGAGLAVVGTVWSIMSVASLLMRYISGVLFDRLSRKGGSEDEKFFGFTAIMNSVTWVLRVFVASVSQVLLVELSFGLLGTAYRNISDDYIYLGGKRMSEIAYFTYREMAYSIASVVLLGLMIVGVFFGVWKEIVFITASFWVLLSAVQARESNMHHK